MKLTPINLPTWSPVPRHRYPLFITSQWTKQTTASWAELMLPATHVYNTSKPAMFLFVVQWLIPLHHNKPRNENEIFDSHKAKLHCQIQTTLPVRCFQSKRISGTRNFHFRTIEIFHALYLYFIFGLLPTNSFSSHQYYCKNECFQLAGVFHKERVWYISQCSLSLLWSS